MVEAGWELEVTSELGPRAVGIQQGTAPGGGREEGDGDGEGLHKMI